MQLNSQNMAEPELHQEKFKAVNRLIFKLKFWNDRKTHLSTRYGIHYQELQKQFLKLNSPDLSIEMIKRCINRIKLITELFSEEMMRENAISLNQDPLYELNKRTKNLDLVFIDGDFVFEQKIQAEINNDGWAVAYIPLSDKYDVSVLLSETDQLLQLGEVLVVNSSKKEFKTLKRDIDYQLGALEAIHKNIYEANQSSYLMFASNSQYCVASEDDGYFAVVGIRGLS